MSTKGLMADKRVASVELNEAGKAARLTLAPGWTYEGSAGPFDLKNVDHGHQIVKAAKSDGSVASAPRARKATTPGAPKGAGVPPSPNPARTTTDPSALPPGSPRRHEMFVYRVMMVSEVNNHERGSWFRSTQPATDEQKKRHIAALGHMGLRHPVDSYKPSFRRWTKADERKARAEQSMGCPWGQELMLSDGE